MADLILSCGLTKGEVISRIGKERFRVSSFKLGMEELRGGMGAFEAGGVEADLTEKPLDAAGRKKT